MDSTSAPFYLIGLLLGGAGLSAALYRVPRLSVITGGIAFAIAEVVVGILASGKTAAVLPPIESTLFVLEGYRVDAASLIILFCVTSFLVINAFADEEKNRGRLAPLFLLAAAGGVACAASQSLLVTVLGLELTALAAHGITGFPRLDRLRGEALWKQYVFHGLGSVCLLIGCALMDSQFGTLEFSALHEAAGSAPPSALVTSACLMILFGLAQRLGAFPFQSWPADTSEGSPWGAIFLETAGRLIGFTVLYCVFLDALLPLKHVWLEPLWIIAGLTLAWGAFGALAQDNLKRLLAYLGQAHVGWMLLFSAASVQTGIPDTRIFAFALVFGLVALGLRAGISIVERETRDSDIYQLSGMGQTHPVISIWWTLLCLAGAGFPPTAGFMAQTALFLKLGSTRHPILLLAVVAAGLAVAYSYLRMIAYLYGKESRGPVTLTHRAALPLMCLSACALLGVALLFIWK